MNHLIKVTVHRHHSSPDKPNLDVAELFFPSYAKAGQYLKRLGFDFQIWKDDCLKFHNPLTEEFCFLFHIGE